MCIQAKAAITTLRSKDAQDLDANLLYDNGTCAFENQMENGHSPLAAVSDAGLKKLAEMEIQKPANTSKSRYCGNKVLRRESKHIYASQGHRPAELPPWVSKFIGWLMTINEKGNLTGSAINDNR